MKVNYLDLFSGIGGFSKGLQMSGVEFGWHGFSEIDKYAISVYRRHFPDAKPLGSITALSTKGFPPIDLVTFGFPCQDLSIAGKRKGLDGRRSGLFFEAIRIIDEVKPRYFVFENVKGLLSSNDGKDFETVLRTIADIGYDGQWQLLNTSWFLPQNRERVYFVGYSGKGSRPQVFPIGEGDKVSQESRRQGKVTHQLATTITQNLKRGVHSGGETLIQVGNVDTKGNNSIWGRVYDPTGIATTLTDGGGMGAKTGLYCVPVLTPDRIKKRQNGRRFKDDGDPSFTLTGQDIHGVMVPEATAQGYAIAKEGDSINLSNPNSATVDGMRIRRLTPKCCERLQGFPDDWTRYGADGKEISDSQRYKMCGNAVTTKVVQAVISRLFKEN